MKKSKPLLLDNGQQPKTYVIKIELSGGDWAELRFSMKDAATGEYNRIRSSGIYGGIWIKNIEMGLL
jgi:hypothetical protein